MTDTDQDIDEVEQLVVPGVMTRKELQNSRSRLRNWLSRDNAASEKRARVLAEQLLATADNAAYSKHRETRRAADSLMSSIGSLANRVLVSMQVTAKVTVTHGYAKYMGRTVNAYTDFDTIQIQVDTDRFNINSVESISELVHVIKGLVYHEGGHIAWTTPRRALCDRNNCGSQHVINGEIVHSAHMQQAWNVLEDQRMERAMVVTSPVMGKYFTTIVAKYVVNPTNPGLAWPWLAGRTYMPKEIRRAVRAAAEQLKAAHLIPKMEAVISRYCNASDVTTMHDAVVEMHEYLNEWLNSNGGTVAELDRHSGLHWDESRSKEELRPIPTPPEPPEPPKGKDKAESSNRGDEDGERNDGNEQPNGSDKPDKSDELGDGDEQENQSKKSDSTVKSAGTESGEKSIPEQLRDLINENIASTNIAEVNEVMSDINTNRGMMAIRDNSIQPMTEAEIVDSQAVRNRMLDVLDKLIVQVDPSWLFYQENGIIDPTAYLTREPGDMNFWSGMNGDKGNGHDLSVSLLIDSSGSMGNAIQTVSIIAMGIRKACEHYEIPCTITTFCDETRLVVAGDEECGFVKVEAGGGTSIFDAMTILDDQVYGNNNHLVVILTDGEWSDLKDVRIWGTPTRHIMIVGYNVYQETITNKGANSAITISDINELAPLVTSCLAGYFAG